MAGVFSNFTARRAARLSGDDETPDGETLALIRKVNAILAAPSAPSIPPMEAARQAASAVFQTFAGPAGAAEIDELVLAGDVRARRYRPLTEKSGALPGALIVFIHGGGWMVGSLDDYDALLSRLAARSGAIFISLDYRLSPENPYPAALEDCRRALAAISENAGTFGFDRARLAVMGDSAGGNLAAVLAQERARESMGGGPVIAAQFLLYPMLDISRPHRDYPSRIAFGGGEYFLTRDAIDAAAASYLSDPGLARDPCVSPLLADNLAGAPRSFILVGGCDPLRDEARAYALRLAEAGAAVDFDCEPGGIHALLSFGVLQSAKRAETRLVEAVMRILKK